VVVAACDVYATSAWAEPTARPKNAATLRAMTLIRELAYEIAFVIVFSVRVNKDSTSAAIVPR